MAADNGRRRSMLVAIRYALAGLLIVALLFAWWRDRGGIAAELASAQAALDQLREARDMPEEEKRVLSRKATRMPGIDKIELGMSLAEVEAILGGPAERTNVQKGLVKDPFTFAVAFDSKIQERDGHKDYEFRQWSYGGRYGVVIFDENQRVVCRY
jgi:hypothetical protein